jgi:hypothetical protein
MKYIQLFSSLGLCLLLLGCATPLSNSLNQSMGAHLGQSEAQITKQLGAPTFISKDGSKRYSDGSQSLSVHYTGGICDAVVYLASKQRKLNDSWVSCVLSENSRGRAWVVNSKSETGRLWYQTLDGKYHAYSDTGGLFVDTDAHLRKGRQIDGKTTPARASAIAVLYPDCAHAWLGQTEAEMTKFLGKPTAGKDKGPKVYQDNGVQVRATFDHGVCSRIIYISDKGRKFTDHWVSATLALNSGGCAWITHEATKPKKVFYHSGDGKFYARLKNGNELGVMIEAVYKNAKNKLEAAHQNSN